MPNIEVDNEFLELFYGVTNTKAPSELTLIGMKKQLADIINVFKEVNANSSKPYSSKVLGTKENTDDENSEENTGPAILIVDDLGVITYQLKVLLSKFNYDIECSQEIYDAVNKFKRRKFTYVVMDLFIPTEREGFILLTELRKMAISSGIKTIIGIITASSRKEIEQQCLARGADFFLEKNNDWQNSLLNIMSDYINVDKEPEEEY